MPVYLIRAGETDAVKIGMATNAAKRLASLQWSNHERLSLLREMPGRRNQEMWLHRYFAPRRMHGEWYRFCDEMLTVQPHGVTGDLARWMDEVRVSHIGISVRAGVTAAIVSDICCGKRPPSARFLAALEETAGVAIPLDLLAHLQIERRRAA